MNLPGSEKVQQWALVNKVKGLKGFVKGRQFLQQLKNYQSQTYSFNMFHTQLDSRYTENTTKMLLSSWNQYGFN